MSMIAKLNFQEVPLDWLNPAAYNPRVDLQPGDKEYEKIKRSIGTLDYVDPIIANKDGTVISGHQRLKVLMDLGYSAADVVIVDKTKDEEKALNIALNQISGKWDFEKLAEVIGEIDVSGLDVSLTGFDDDQIKKMIGTVDTDWFEQRERFDDSRQEDNQDYNDFLGKFEIKKTTDDCYTPDKVYEAVVKWVQNEYGVKEESFVRPFYPGGDYENEQYTEGCVVVDNPPFSILADILKFYDERNIKFFLFAPALTLFSSSVTRCCSICTGVTVIYENGANVNTSFLTNLEEARFRTAPSLYKAVTEAVEQIRNERKKELPKYEYPDNVVTAIKLSNLSKYGIDFKVSKEESFHIRALDAQKEEDKAIFGSGYLISERAAAERAAAERAAAERAAAERWTLSERERAIVDSLGSGVNE